MVLMRMGIFLGWCSALTYRQDGQNLEATDSIRSLHVLRHDCRTFSLTYRIVLV